MTHVLLRGYRGKSLCGLFLIKRTVIDSPGGGERRTVIARPTCVSGDRGGVKRRGGRREGRGLIRAIQVGKYQLILQLILKRCLSVDL